MMQRWRRRATSAFAAAGTALVTACAPATTPNPAPRPTTGQRVTDVVIAGDFTNVEPPEAMSPKDVYRSGQSVEGDQCDGKTTPPPLSREVRDALRTFTRENKVFIHVCNDDGSVVGYVSEQGRYFLTNGTQQIDLGPDVLQQRGGTPTADPFKGAVLFLKDGKPNGIVTVDGVGNVYTIGTVPKGLSNVSSLPQAPGTFTGLVVAYDQQTDEAAAVLITQTSGTFIPAPDPTDPASVALANRLFRAVVNAGSKPLDNSLALG